MTRAGQHSSVLRLRTRDISHFITVGMSLDSIEESWILKQRGLEISGKILISLNGKTMKVKYLFFLQDFLKSDFKEG